MTSRIVHFYFSGFRLIRREIRHFVFCIGSYETDKAYSSAISLGVAAKTRTKPTGAPPIVKRTNMTLTMAYCRIDLIYSRNKPLFYIVCVGGALSCQFGDRGQSQFYIVDMEDIRNTIRKGRYSDKQTTKRSFPIPALM